MRRPPSLGERLLQDGHISARQLREALDRQQREGGLLSSQLVLGGAVPAPVVFGVLADQWRAPLVDLDEAPPDPDLARMLPPRTALAEGWLPWRRDGEGAVVATSVAPDAQLRARAAAVLEVDPPERIRFRAATPGSLGRAVERSHRPCLAAGSRPADSFLSRCQRLAPGLLAVALLAVLALEPGPSLAGLLLAADVALLASACATLGAAALLPLRRWRRASAACAEIRERRRRGLAPVWRPRQEERDRPLHTLLVTIPPGPGLVARLGGLLAAVDRLDQPRSRLDLVLLVGEADTEGRQVVEQTALPAYARMALVPGDADGLAYGLALARGELVGVLGVDDRPDRDQLVRAVDTLRRDDLRRDAGLRTAPLVAVQAPVQAGGRGLLGSLAALGAVHHHRLRVPTLAALGLPVPLEGSGFHARAAALRELDGPAPGPPGDLALRAAAAGMRTGQLPGPATTTTLAEPSQWWPGEVRRRRALLLTAARHTRRPWRRLGAPTRRGLLGALVVLGGLVSAAAYPLAVGAAAAYAVRPGLLAPLPGPAALTGGVVLVSAGVSVAVDGALAVRHLGWRAAPAALLTPLARLAHSLAAWWALIQVVTTPSARARRPGRTKGHHHERPDPQPHTRA